MSSDELIQGVRAGDRRWLAKAITLVESARPEHQTQAAALLDGILDTPRRAVRLGVSGAPGAGKSSLIECLGMQLVESGTRVAVLAVDPSSQVSGGSILGDKTRMERLGVHPMAFIRPSPARGSLGGVATHTREAMLLCEAAGYDVVVVETVGVGQSEATVADLVDFCAVLIPPGAGDALQGMKRGLIELADALLINKVDVDSEAAARTARDYSQALELLGVKDDGWAPQVLQISAHTGQGVDTLWQQVQAQRHVLGADGLEQRRLRQAVRWFHAQLEQGLWRALRGDPTLHAELRALEQAVLQGQMHPDRAARKLIAHMLAPRHEPAG
ncbi:MAG: methylmalonyl Co-A mutase-associated GTPase MeaB [Pseudomonadota bacterium]